MGKSNAKKSRKRKGNNDSCWSSEDFNRRSYEQTKKEELRQLALGGDDEGDDGESSMQNLSVKGKSRNGAKKMKKKPSQLERSMLLSHGTEDKIERKKLMLQISLTKKEISALRERLESWDAVKEEKDERERERKAEEEAKRLSNESIDGMVKKRRRKRPGPETWKLRGAARPAYEVYDFDVRYVDLHAKAFEDEKERVRRSINVLKVYRGKFGTEESPKCCRQFLALLFQLGMLHIEAKQYKGARETFRECIDLEGENAITMSRQRLMRMYLDCNRPDSARRLYERTKNQSVWIRYSAALMEYVSFSLLEEEGSSKEIASNVLSQAFKANIFCAFYLAFHSDFSTSMEYVDEIEDADEGTLEEAIEYCNSDQMGHWLGTDGALEWVRETLLKIWNGEVLGECSQSDLKSWDKALSRIEYQFEVSQPNDEKDEPEEETLDILMYTGMYRTAIDMLLESGQL